MRMTATDKRDNTHEVNVVNPLGHEDNPVSTDDLAKKFTRLCESRLGVPRTATALAAWQKIEFAADISAAFDALTV